MHVTTAQKWLYMRIYEKHLPKTETNHQIKETRKFFFNIKTVKERIPAANTQYARQ